MDVDVQVVVVKNQCEGTPINVRPWKKKLKASQSVDENNERTRKSEITDDD